ncbi:MAG: hypothetical protein J5I93_14820 [Pirellulaceae bacterium]|nr:hypothetical protein [Pirellulaceae bacterium]
MRWLIVCCVFVCAALPTQVWGQPDADAVPADRPPTAATLQLWLVKAYQPLSEPASLTGQLAEVARTIARLDSDDVLFVPRQLQLTALENQPASLHIGVRTPVRVGTIQGGFGRASNYRDEALGLILSATYRQAESGELLWEVQFELSELTEQDAAEPGEIAPPAVTTFQFRSTVRLADGHAVLAQQAAEQGNGQTHFQYLVIGANLQPAGQAQMNVRALERQPPPPDAASASPPQVTRRPAISERTASDRPPTVTPPAVTPPAVTPPAVTPPAAAAPRETTEPPAAGVGADSATAEPPVGASSETQYAAAARGYFERYDQDGSGVLEQNEWDSVRGLPPEVDANQDRQVTREELIGWLRERLGESPAPVDSNVQRGSLAEYTLRRHDTDGSGALERGEWPALGADAASADTNQDQVISREELIVWLQRRLRPTEAQADAAASATSRLTPQRYLQFADALLKRHDRNADNRLDAAEQSGMSTRLTGADADEDGFVTVSELAAWLQSRSNP